MYRLYIFYLFASINLYALDISLLTSAKQEIFKQKKNAIESSAVQLRYNWVSPVTLSSSLRTSKGLNDTIHNSSIQLNQDIYRFGGIGKSMSYADSKLAYDMISLEEENAVIYQELLVGILELKKLKIALKQVDYRLKNSDIELFLKQEQYKMGDVDITLMNDAIMNKNSILKSMITTKESIITQKIALQKITFLPLSKIKVLRFKKISKKLFLENNFDILQAKLESKLAGTQYEITKKDYLPKVSMSGQLGYQDSFNNISTIENSYHSVGLTISMPLKYTSSADIEEKKVLYMKTTAVIDDVEFEKVGLYQQSINKINNYIEYNKIIRDNMKLYKQLISIAQKSFKAGYKSGYDLKTLQNTQKIDKLEIEINKINIEIEKAKLRFACNLGERYYARQH